jgi:hypothetical protein
MHPNMSHTGLLDPIKWDQCVGKQLPTHADIRVHSKERRIQPHRTGSLKSRKRNSSYPFSADAFVPV